VAEYGLVVPLFDSSISEFLVPELIHEIRTFVRKVVAEGKQYE
jgi:hypothetical protein